MDEATSYTELQHLSNFLGAFARFEKRVAVGNSKEEIARLRNLFTEFQNLDKRLEPLRKLEAPKYNLFEILNISHLEAKVHTPFLGNLLRPWGSHHQGAVFLHSFLEKVASRPKWVEGLQNVRIIEEQNTGNGFADIVIRGRNSEGPFGIVIENKIYAGDQPQQLERYQQYLEYTLELPAERCLLIYLAPHRKRPSIPRSITQEDFDTLHGAGRLLLRSYHQDIRDWLKPFLSSVEAPKVRFILEQYLQIITKL